MNHFKQNRLPCSKDWCFASFISIRRNERFLQFFYKQDGDIPENLGIISDNPNIVGTDTNSDDEYEVDDAEYNPKYDPIVIIGEGLNNINRYLVNTYNFIKPLE